MIAGVFTAKQWQTAEQWNNGWLIVAIVVILFIIFCLAVVAAYVPNPWKWRIIVPASLVCASLALYSWLRTDNAANYQFNQWAAKITPQIRTKKAALFMGCAFKRWAWSSNCLGTWFRWALPIYP
ncbi:MAG: hypothetical protein ACFN39_13140, partial [Lacticaseibacillus rhamnosus]